MTENDQHLKLLDEAKCIDGQFRQNVVAYCHSPTHRGFLTTDLMLSHECSSKQCNNFEPLDEDANRERVWLLREMQLYGLSLKERLRWERQAVIRANRVLRQNMNVGVAQVRLNPGYGAVVTVVTEDSPAEELTVLLWHVLRLPVKVVCRCPTAQEREAHLRARREQEAREARLRARQKEEALLLAKREQEKRAALLRPKQESEAFQHAKWAQKEDEPVLRSGAQQKTEWEKFALTLAKQVLQNNRYAEAVDVRLDPDNSAVVTVAAVYQPIQKLTAQLRQVLRGPVVIVAYRHPTPEEIRTLLWPKREKNIIN